MHYYMMRSSRPSITWPPSTSRLSTRSFCDIFYTRLRLLLTRSIRPSYWRCSTPKRCSVFWSFMFDSRSRLSCHGRDVKCVYNSSWEPVSELRSVTCITYTVLRATWHRWTCCTVTPARQASTWFPYPGEMARLDWLMAVELMMFGYTTLQQNAKSPFLLGVHWSVSVLIFTCDSRNCYSAS